MVNPVYQTQKIALNFSKKEIDRAASSIRHGCIDEDRIDAIDKIQNFRAIHLYPLMLMKNHLARTANKVSKNIIIARRLKRLPTIIDKLERPTLDGVTDNAIKLTRMQDIGGCRAIVKNLSTLLMLKRRLENSSSVHEIVKVYDYLKPKDSGYGGIHLVYSCFHNANDDNEWKRTKIEIQLRTNLQHAWATSLEIIDTLEQIKLKTSLEGHDDWRRFFYISGVLVAHDEGASVLPANEINELNRELASLEEKLDVLSKLLKFSLAIKAVTSRSKDKKHDKSQGMCLVIMEKENFIEELNEDFIKIKLHVKKFNLKDSNLAIAELNKSEKDENVIISALLSTSDAKNLKKAYPNYFGSTSEFGTFINKHIKQVKSL